MVDCLDQARHLSSDPAPGPSIVVSTRVRGRGCPRVEIEPNFLAQALSLRGPTHLQSVFRCSARTVRRAALRHGLAEPGNPVYTAATRLDGSAARIYSSTAPAMSAISDAQLDSLLTSILQVFPDFGRCMLSGRLKAAGYRVSRACLMASYLRVHGAPGGFGVRFIHRKPYNVAGANSLWHHDGQHGTSVHNTGIERLWYDVTHGFGQKWKTFFTDLEVNHGLNPTIPAHIWLLHHLFLAAINADAQEWAEAWNSHDLQIRGERTRSPRDMFLFSMVRDGPRGLEQSVEPPSEDVEEPAAYGIDWQATDDPQLMTHLLNENPVEWEEQSPFTSGPPAQSHVPCEPPTHRFPLSRLRSSIIGWQLW
ncbi:hypothetical protein B0H16DRAFT_1352730 [Mycena metata]|uniref:Integrase core domain-containing protein n=1 Tax=Mycena metata TaxID=1033252 RepID=A0AAD7DIU3_9AGAR|nr:hypothetical protein B0H16DRAFT_1352730 [Mycena metata]